MIMTSGPRDRVGVVVGVIALLASVALATPGGTAPVLEIVESVGQFFGEVSAQFVRTVSDAEVAASKSYTYTFFSFVFAWLAFANFRGRLRWLVWLVPLIALLGSMSLGLKWTVLWLGS